MAALPAEQPDWVPEDTFAARLALVRNHMGWNVKEAADECGIPEQNWRNWEAGRSPHRIHEKVRKIADRTGVDYRWLLAGGPLPRSRCLSALPPVMGQMTLFSSDGVGLSDHPVLLALAN